MHNELRNFLSVNTPIVVVAATKLSFKTDIEYFNSFSVKVLPITGVVPVNSDLTELKN